MARIAVLTCTAPTFRGFRKGQRITLDEDDPRVAQLLASGKMTVKYRAAPAGLVVVKAPAGVAHNQLVGMLGKFDQTYRGLSAGDLAGLHQLIRNNPTLLAQVVRYFAPAVVGALQTKAPEPDQAQDATDLWELVLGSGDLFTAAGLRKMAERLGVALPPGATKAQTLEVLADHRP